MHIFDGFEEIEKEIPGEEISPELQPIYEKYFYFGKLQASMALPSAVEYSDPAISLFNFPTAGHSDAFIETFAERYLEEEPQALPSIADWTLTRPPEPHFTTPSPVNDNQDFIENNLNNFCLTSGSEMDTMMKSDILRHLENQDVSSSKQKQEKQCFLNRYIAVLGDKSSTPHAETPTFEQITKNQYMCNICKCVVNSVHEKFIHRNKHLGRTFQCQYCGLVFPTSIDVVRHVHITHRSASQKCPKCSFVASDMQSFFLHMDTEHPVVNEATSPASETEWITLESMSSPGFENTPFQKDTPSIDELTATFQPTPLDNMSLGGSPENGELLAMFANQQASKMQGWDDISSPCKRQKLVDGSSHPVSPSPDQIYSSSSSSPSLSDSTDYTDHVCDLCGQFMDTQLTYNNHLWQCHVVVSNTCPFPDCDSKAFAEGSQLTKHFSNTHTSQRRFRCPLCKKTFKTQSQCRKHEDEVHINSEVRPFKCPWQNCDKRFKATKHLSVHLLIHTDSKPIQCHLCEYRCRQRNSINYHYKTKHPGVSPPKAQVTEMLKNSRAQLQASCDAVAST